MFLNTGSPHYVIFANNVETLDILSEARKIRFNNRFRDEGTNVDFVEISKNQIFVRTYERGVENETLSCGTGVTAAALASAVKYPSKNSSLEVHTRGGILKVSFTQEGNSFSNIWLEGPATFVFQGTAII
jgi:diaminopimelate epimerase